MIMARCWYGFLDGGGNFSPLDSSKYFKTSIAFGCLIGTKICTVYVPDCDWYPSSFFSTNLQNYISNALISGIPQPTFPIGAKKYVYLKF